MRAIFKSGELKIRNGVAPRLFRRTAVERISRTFRVGTMTNQDRLSHFMCNERARSARRDALTSQQAIADRIYEIVLNVLRRRLPVAELPGGITFDVLSVDAFERVYIADEIEREWSIEIPDDLVDAWQSIEQMTASVVVLLSGAGNEVTVCVS
jgi:acyl carrier protein